MFEELKAGDSFEVSDLRNFLNAFSRWGMKIDNISADVAKIINTIRKEMIAAEAMQEVIETYSEE